MDSEYPFPKRADGHPQLAALIERLLVEHRQGAHATTKTPLTILTWDTEHRSPLIKEALSFSNVMEVLHRNRVLILNEGPQSLNSLLESYHAGRTTEQEARYQYDPAYHTANPALHTRLQDAWHGLWTAVKHHEVDLFHPEPERPKHRGGPSVLSRTSELFDTVILTGGFACTDVMINTLKAAAPGAFDTYADQRSAVLEDRRGDALNKAVVETATERRGDRPILVHYGAGHGVLQDHFATKGPVVGITMITSEQTPYQLSSAYRLGQFVYFAAEDKVVEVPKDEKGRAEFIERLASPPVVFEPKARTANEKISCFDRAIASADAASMVGHELIRVSGLAASEEAVGRSLLLLLREEFLHPGTAQELLRRMSGSGQASAPAQTDDRVHGHWDGAPTTPNSAETRRIPNR